MSDQNMRVQTTVTSQAQALTMPETISLSKWEDTGFEWSGVVMPNTFERLAALLSDESEQPPLSISTTLYRRNNVLHARFQSKGDVWLTCQRCLQPVIVELTDDYDIALLDDDSQVSLMNENQDYLLLDEIITESSSERLLPFKKLIEDEILLKVPMAPKHDDCEMAVDQVGDIPEEENESPFASLASLKSKL